ncbi:MAG: type II toxin-antitoxin system prevent-host-death family antitoxin [Acidobacteriota bacterium]
MPTVNIHQAKPHLSRLVEQASRGQETVIAKAGTPVARLGPLGRVTRPKRFGLLKGHIRIDPDVDAPLPGGVLALFEGQGR